MHRKHREELEKIFQHFITHFTAPKHHCPADWESSNCRLAQCSRMRGTEVFPQMYIMALSSNVNERSRKLHSASQQKARKEKELQQRCCILCTRREKTSSVGADRKLDFRLELLSSFNIEGKHMKRHEERRHPSSFFCLSKSGLEGVLEPIPAVAEQISER